MEVLIGNRLLKSFGQEDNDHELILASLEKKHFEQYFLKELTEHSSQCRISEVMLSSTCFVAWMLERASHLCQDRSPQSTRNFKAWLVSAKGLHRAPRNSRKLCIAYHEGDRVSGR